MSIVSLGIPGIPRQSSQVGRVLVPLACFLMSCLSVAGANAGPTSDLPGANFDLEPAVGTAPLQVSLRGTISACINFAQYEWTFGDGSTERGIQWPEDSVWTSTNHTYTCPGKYEIRYRVDTPCGWNENRKTLRVGSPELSLYPFSGSEDKLPGFPIRLVAMEGLKTLQLDRSVVDWGDETPPEEISWERLGTGYGTPYHIYALPGEYTVRVTNEYVGSQCSFKQAAISVIEVGQPTPTKQTSWGRIKSLFAE
jgi:PKD repeat protein